MLVLQRSRTCPNEVRIPYDAFYYDERLYSWRPQDHDDTYGSWVAWCGTTPYVFCGYHREQVRAAIVATQPELTRMPGWKTMLRIVPLTDEMAETLDCIANQTKNIKAQITFDSVAA